MRGLQYLDCEGFAGGGAVTAEGAFLAGDGNSVVPGEGFLGAGGNTLFAAAAPVFDVEGAVSHQGLFEGIGDGLSLEFGYVCLNFVY